ncbi:Signal transduction histidine-protein kinase AtoS [subsurface metagenome]
MKEIEQSLTLTATDKKRIINGFIELSAKIEDVDDYNRKAREGLETMASLGVVAGFITHESRRITSNLDTIIKTLRDIVRKHPEIEKSLKVIEASFREFSGQVAYASTFIEAVQNDQVASFKAVPQIERIKKTFGAFVREKGIQVDIHGDPDTETPPLPIALYSGILLNLYSNAIKAVMAGPSNNKNPRIAFKVWNDPKYHIIEVADNGVGIPDNLKKRIWDPLFTTTSRLNNPLGSGMGLGLSLIKKLAKNVGGTMSLVDAPPGYSTCFRVEFSMKGK